MRSPRTAILVGLLSLGLAGAAYAITPPASPTKPVDLSRYYGRWYELARVPNQFEKGAACSAPTADYSQGHGGAVSVTQICHQGGVAGAPLVYHASGKILDPGTNAKLRLTYFVMITRDYWVLDHASDYSWAIVGDPTGKYLWILGRSPVLSGAARADLLQRARGLGYDTGRLEFPAQR